MTFILVRRIVRPFVSIELQKAFRHFPVEKGIYEVAPGLRPLGDRLVFRVDDQFLRYRDNKINCYQERIPKYFQKFNYSDSVSAAVNKYLVSQVTKEYPKLFSFSGDSLHCVLTDQNIPFSKDSSFFESFCMQVQEDIAVVCRDGDKNWLAAIHLCSPSHWSAEEKIGKSFVEIHSPIPGIEKVNSIAPQLVSSMVEKGPWERFVWGFGSDNRLNHHPIAPPGFDSVKWKGRSFNGHFYLRYERQVIVGLPSVNAALFFIRPYFIDGNEIRKNSVERDLLISGLRSMNAESRAYKGLADCMDELIFWLETPV
jgi:dimethylamine monooxygenase subunit A